MYGIEHPNIDKSRFTETPMGTTREAPALDSSLAQSQVDKLCQPLELFSPVIAAMGCGRNSR